MRRLLGSTAAFLANGAVLSSAPSSSSWRLRGASTSAGDNFDDDADLDRALNEAVSAPGSGVGGSGSSADATTEFTSDIQQAAAASSQDAATRSIVNLVPMQVPPTRFDILANASVYKWETKAQYARKVTGPMREWCDEIKYRTGVHVEVEPLHRDRLLNKSYASADDVDVVVYFFGAERAIRQCVALLDSAIEQDPMYVRLAVFRRLPNDKGVQWLTLRRINRDHRPPDIPPVSLKLPGKWTLMYENPKEAAVRTLWEETGIRVDPKKVYPSAMLRGAVPEFYWRVPVRYYVAEVPHDVKVTGPHSATTQYMQGWDPRLLRQSPDPIDRIWATEADPVTGCAWLPTKTIDELQEPLKGKHYMARRYTPPPISGLQEVLNLEKVDLGPGFSPSV